MARDTRSIRRAVVDVLEARQLMAAELIANGSFLHDTVDWNTTGDFHADHTYSTYRSGPGYAYLSGSSGTLATSSGLTGTLSQTIKLPSTAATANLQFYYRTATEDGNSQADSLSVRIKNTSGTVLQTLTTLYNVTNSAYVPSAVFNLAAFAGQTIVLSFEGQTDASLGTVFRIDDVSLQATSSSAPTIPAPTLAYPGVPTTTGLPVVNSGMPGFVWNAVSGAVGYGLKLELANTRGYTTVFDSTTDANMIGKPIGGTNFTIPLALGAGSYRWSVTAYDDAVTMTAPSIFNYFTLATSGYTRALGVDISKYQTLTTPSQFTAIKNDSTAFIWMKASQGVGSPDTTFPTKASAATAAGVNFGAYHYPTPNNGGTTTDSMRADAIAEANDFYSRISSTLVAGNFVPMLDFEDPAVTQSIGLLSLWANTFCERITALTGLTPVIYSGQNYAYNHLNLSALRYPAWIAQYPSTTPNPQTASGPSDPSGAAGPASPWPTWAIWQYTSSASVGGVTPIDRDVLNGDVASLRALKITSTTGGSITGTVFNDANGDGIKDAAEAGIAGRTIFLDANNNGTLDSGEVSVVTGSNGVYTFTNKPEGAYSIRPIVPAGFFATGATSYQLNFTPGQATAALTFGSKPIDTTPPTLVSSNFAFASAGRTISLVFSDDVTATLTNSDAVLTNLTTGLVVPTTMAYDAATKTAVFTPLAAEFTNGNYTLMLAAGSVADAAGNTSAAINVDFYWLAGDINRDRNVNFDDLVPLAQNYNTSGDYNAGDLTGDGTINFDDLVVLAQNYNSRVDEIITPPAGLVAAITAKITPTSKAPPKKRAIDGVVT